MKARAWSLVSLVLSLALAPGAHAQGSELERAKASFRAGANAYAAGDYPAAIQALEAAYTLTPLPAIAFSLAQAERKQFVQTRRPEHLERALQLFRRYIEEEPGGARRTDAELAIKALEAELGGASPRVGQTPAKPQTRPTRLMIVSDTPGAQISLDGGTPGASPLIREVTPGTHRARVRARGHFEVVRDVTAVAGELLLTEVHLREQPTSLYVWAPEGADVYVDGVYVGEGGGTLTVPLEAGNHQLSVAQKGRRLERRDIKLSHGQARTELVTLEPTAQRGISELLFIGSGAALGAGLALSALAVRSENRAEDFVFITKRRSASVGEHVSYNASIVARNRYRTAAAISAAGAVGMFVTGLFLHELDQPNPVLAPRREAPRGRDAQNDVRLDFAPALPSGDLGAALKVTF